MNLLGSFIPLKHEEAFFSILNRLQTWVEEDFGIQETNFLSLKSLPDLNVKRGDNILDTCFQYAIKDSDGDKLLVIKFYDKMLDLISRESYHIVSSRVSEILGSKRTLNSFNKRLRSCQQDGMTRIEVSICRAAFVKLNPTQASVKTQWHSKVQVMMD